MDFSRLVELSTTGVAAIDEAHREIERLSRLLFAACDRDALADEVPALYEAFRDVALRHFEFEEALIARIVQRDPAVADHLKRHRENHNTLRDAFAYADAKFAEPGRTDIPSIVPLLPGKYLEQLVEMDEEMLTLL